MARVPAVTLETEFAIARIRNAQIASREPRSLILSVVPEVETRVDEIIRVIVNEADFADTVVGAFLVGDNLDTYFRTWADRQKIMKEILAFDVSGQRIGQQFQHLLEIRNALMHGNGTFTHQQSSRFKRLMDLEKSLAKEFSVVTQGQKLILENLNTAKVGEVAQNYLVAVDQKFMERS